MFTFYVGKVKSLEDIRTMEIAIDMENLANKACDEMCITRPCEREQFITTAILCNMMKFSSDDEIARYFTLIRDITACMKPSEKQIGMTRLSALLCMVANAYVYNHRTKLLSQSNEVNKSDVDVSRTDAPPVSENI
jgi:hypothetical protein